MRCSACGTENPDGKQFCTECGTALTLGCPSCGATIAGTEKFCGECGAPLADATALPGPAAATSRPVAAASQASAPVAERRLVSVLFADLVGFTALSRELGAEEAHALLERFFGRADRIVQEHGGRVDKHIGDCVMAVFGAPVAHGNDA